MSDYVRFARLVQSFHALAQCPAVSGEEVDLNSLDEWAIRMDPQRDDGVAVAAAFVLNLWSRDHVWLVGKFDLFEAIIQWDDRHLAAFKLWAASPWRP